MRAMHVVQVNARPGQVEEFTRWYDMVHVPDVLSIPGVLGARRYELADEQLGRRAREYPYRFLTLYELDGDPAEIVRAIDRAIGDGRFDISPTLDPDYVAPVFRLGYDPDHGLPPSDAVLVPAQNGARSSRCESLPA